MLTAHLNIGPGSILIIGVTPEDLRQLSADNSVTMDGAEFGLPDLKIFVMPAQDEGAFRTSVFEIVDEAKPPGFPIHEVQRPATKVRS